MIRKLFCFFLIICMLAILPACTLNTVHEVPKEDTTIRISGAWALYPMMLVWADEYKKGHDVEFEIDGGGAGKGMSDVLNGQVDIGMVSRAIKAEELEQGAFYLAVAKDTVMGIINDENPIINEIYEHGLTQEDLRRIFLKEVTHWGELVGKTLENDSIIVYGRSDSSGAASVWASFLGDYTQADLQNTADANLNGDQPIANSVQNEKNSISFTNMNYVYDVKTLGFIDKIRPVPVDLNNDKNLDDNESFYNDRDKFLKAVSDGIYPSPPTREEYLVGNGAFKAEVKEFIEWILSDGQLLLEGNGYVQLQPDQLQKEKDYLSNGKR